MSVTEKNEYGKINITPEVIAGIVGETASSCYGVLGLAARSGLRETMDALLKKKSDYIKGVYPRKKKDGYEVDVHIIVIYGVKLTEVVSSVQKAVAYTLKKTFAMRFIVNVFVQEVRKND